MFARKSNNCDRRTTTKPACLRAMTFSSPMISRGVFCVGFRPCVIFLPQPLQLLDGDKPILTLAKVGNLRELIVKRLPEESQQKTTWLYVVGLALDATNDGDGADLRQLNRKAWQSSSRLLPVAPSFKICNPFSQG